MKVDIVKVKPATTVAPEGNFRGLTVRFPNGVERYICIPEVAWTDKPGVFEAAVKAAVINDFLGNQDKLTKFTLPSFVPASIDIPEISTDVKEIEAKKEA